ncbi:MAG: hypothetical protein IT236_12385 [Bacteroidia bacterium]|nr:hypothetical protein [Bacteroidia bacterium]
MNKEEEIKQSLNDILSSKEFPFDEAAWNSASAYIDNARKQKRRRAFFILFPALLFIAGGFAFYFYSGNTNTTPSLVSQTNTSEQAPAPAISQDNNPSEVTANKAPEIANPPAPANNPPAKEDKQPQPTKPTDVPNIVGTNEPAIKQQQSQTVKTPNNTVPVKTIIQKVLPQVVQATAPIIKEKTNPSSVLPVKSGNGKEKQTSPATNVAETSGTSVPENTFATSNTASVNPVATNSTEVAQVPAVQSPPPLPLPAEEVVTLTAVPASTVAPAKPDSANAQAINTPTLSNPRWWFFAEGGLSYAFGWKNPGIRDGNGFNPVVGVHISHALTNKLTVGLGAQYNQVSQMEYSTKVSKVISYKYTEESDVTVITPQKMYYAVLPLKLSYTINKDNLVGIGYNLAYLINVNSKVETYHVGINNTTDYKVTRSLGYTEGIKTLDKQLAIFYRRHMAEKFWINTELYLGLDDVKDNAFFKSNVKERNSGIKVTLMYNFFSK